MAIGNYDIGGMLARSGAIQGQQMGQAYSQVGQGLGGLLTGVGTGLEARRKRQEKEEVAKQVAGIYAPVTQEGATSTQLFQAAQQLMSMPDKTKEAMALLEQARAMQITEQNKTNLQNLQNDVSLQAEQMGFPELAKQARSASTIERVQDIADRLTERQMETMPALSKEARRRLLLNVGYTPQFVGTLDLENMSKQEFQEYQKLMKGDVELFLENGSPVTYRVTESGMIVKDGQLVDPSTLSLTEAPNQQIIRNVTAGMADELSKLGAKQFAELYDQAMKSSEGIRSIDRIIGDVDTMFTGTLANINLQVQKFMKAVGIPVDDLKIENTEVYQAESAKRVADYIKTLGAGTGLSDNDLKFTLKVVAGDIALDENTIKKVLTEYREAAARKVNGYNKMRSSLSNKLGENEQSALAFYDPVPLPTTGRKYEGFEIVEPTQ